MNQSHRHASTAALAGQKRKLVPRPNSMLMISPASDSNLITAVYQPAAAAAPPPPSGAPNAPAPSGVAAAATGTGRGYTPIQPAPTPVQPWPVVAAAQPTYAPSPAPTALATVNFQQQQQQHATIMTTPMVQQMLAAQQKGQPAGIAMPATLALAHAHAAAASAAAVGTKKQSQPKASTKAANKNTAGKPQPSQEPPKNVAPPQPSPADFVKKCFGEWGVSIKPTRDATYFLKATPDRVAAYNRDLLATVRQSDMAKLQRLHEEGKVKNACNPFGESLLHLACRKGLTEVVEFLCAKPDGPCLSLFVHDDYGRTVMHDACWTVRPQWPLVEFLLEHAPRLLACSDVRGHIPLDYVPKSDWKVWRDFLVERQDKLKAWMMSASSKTPSSSSEGISSPADAAAAATNASAEAPKAASRPSSGIPVPQQVLKSQQVQQQKELKANLQAAVSSSSASLVPGSAHTSQSSSSSSNSLDMAVAEDAGAKQEVPSPTEGSPEAPRIVG
eukprot:CAMPEP_0113463022 /NCGR_PEP_ID=MMETSP0014_2-20120614/12419_1 /TAXON_ID=2857 /ORGANISM="Nitzschia sp." /LENGTH=500 /DNA_ID=CAMNT_0000354955 /DNA_START=460 /DNA_END=1962 /DNA_ORIENTATION=- /assembly_acc=CAM_ASM_000159